MKADLHMHSIYSDGENTPAEIAAMAKAKGIEVIALTDHDSVEGIPEMVEAAKVNGMEIFTGIELSAYNNKEIHILGYNMNIYDVKFKEKLEKFQHMRKARIDAILKKLNTMGILLKRNELVIEKQIKKSVGRLHIAKALIEKGYAKSVSEAFTKWLGYGRPAYVPSDRLLPSEAIKIIKAAGGKAVLAHPSQIDIEQQNFLPLLNGLIKSGLDGIEARYSAHTTAENNYYIKLAREFGLTATCGSDFHGESRETVITGYDLAKDDYLRLKS